MNKAVTTLQSLTLSPLHRHQRAYCRRAVAQKTRFWQNTRNLLSVVRNSCSGNECSVAGSRPSSLVPRCWVSAEVSFASKQWILRLHHAPALFPRFWPTSCQSPRDYQLWRYIWQILQLSRAKIRTHYFWTQTRPKPFADVRRHSGWPQTGYRGRC